MLFFHLVCGSVVSEGIIWGERGVREKESKKKGNERKRRDIIGERGERK